MNRRLSIALSTLTLMAVLSSCSRWTAAAAGSRVLVAGDVPKAVSTATPLGRLSSSATATLALALPVRNAAALDSLLDRLYDPSCPDYGHYLTPAQFTAQFGPTKADYEAVEDYARSQGLTVSQAHPNRLFLDVTGPAGAVEDAFGVHLYNYRGADGRIFHAPDITPSVPKTMASRLSGVVGLSDAAVRQPQNKQILDSESLNLHLPLDGTGPEGGLSPANVKTAYDLSGVTLTGAGQTAAVFELDGYDSSDIRAYESGFSLPNVPIQNVLVDGFSGEAGANASEVVLDIELLLGMAPGISKLLVYETGQSDTQTLDGYDRIANDDLAKEISTSWGLDEEENDSSFLQSENTIFKQMAAQGQTIFAAGGDTGAYDSGNESDGLRVDDPGSQPYVCGVGGTTLFTNGPGGSWSSETTWNGGSIDIGAGGGGSSHVWPIPSWQKPDISSASLASTTMRNVPDVSINADPQNGYTIYYNGSWQVYGGTSAGPPLWAGFTSLVNEQRLTEGRAVIGQITPSLYPILGETSYATDFHDIKDGSTNFYYPAVAGYDDATGIGTPIGANLLATLAPASAPAAPTNLTATAGNGYITLSWHASSTATSYNLYRSTSANSGYSKVVTSTGTSYVNSGLTNGTTYYYVVTAVNNNLASPGSNTASATPFITTPSVPANLVATADNSAVTLSWDAASNAVTYNLYRSTSESSGYAKVVTTSSTSYFDTGLTNGVTYYYVVTAVNNGVASPGSNTVYATPHVITPATPTNLAASAGNAAITLTWNSSANAISYNLYRSTSSATGFFKVVSTSNTRYVDSGLANGTTYYYVVTAVNSGTASAGSNTAHAVPSASIPAAPGSLSATAGNAKVTLTWSAGATAASYNLYRSTNASTGFVRVISTSSTSYIDQGLVNGTTYYYVVTAVNSGVGSASSNTAFATPAS